jgi:hypothetical protein
MGSRFGVCRNQDYCSLALQRAVLRLGPDELFVCPECARPLSAASPWKKGGAGYAAVLRLVPPLGIVAIGVGAIWLGLQHPDAPPPRPVLAQAAPAVAPRKVLKPVAAQKPPVEAVAARPAPLRTVVLLRVAAAPPLNDAVLPQLAAGYLTAAYHGLTVLGSVDDVGHVVLTTGGRILDILVTPASFDAAAFGAGQIDVACTQDEPIAAQLQAAGALAQVPLGDMPGPDPSRIICYGKPGGEAGAFLAFVASAAGRQIVASAGYDFQPVPQPPPPPTVVAAVVAPVPPKPAVTAARPTPKPAVKVAAKGAVKAAPKAGVKPGAVKIAVAAAPAGKPAKPKAAPPPADTAPAAAPDNGTDQDAEAEAPPTPRRIIVPPGSPLTLEALKAMTAPGAPAPQTGDDAAPHPRTVYLPASARLAFGAYHPLKMPDQPPKLSFVRPDAAIRPGSLKADCKIGSDGVPSDCREIAHQGTQEAAAAIMAWLPSGGIRYPASGNDAHAGGRRVITVTFGGTGK